MVTAELAVATLSALTLLVMMCWAIFLVVMQMHCIDTASEVARQAARGDEAAVRVARRDAPAGAQVSIHQGHGQTVVQVHLLARPFASWLVAVPLSAHAQVATEPAGQGSR